MFPDDLPKDCVGFFATYTVVLPTNMANPEYFKFGFVDIASIQGGEDRDEAMRDCKNRVMRFCMEMLEESGRIS